MLRNQKLLIRLFPIIHDIDHGVIKILKLIFVTCPTSKITIAVTIYSRIGDKSETLYFKRRPAHCFERTYQKFVKICEGCFADKGKDMLVVMVSVTDISDDEKKLINLTSKKILVESRRV